ncbi:hypothetical protein DL96DRAFT_598726 [Flagelloscypha sp. PMI_526]|nr:hypothetical protein DL96DRAFT_598726 [Flagelloscypha sp. PMI_526]
MSPTTTASSSDDSAHMGNDKRTLTAGIVLGVFGIIGVAIILFWVYRMKKPQSDGSPSESGKSGYAFTGFGNGAKSANHQGVKTQQKNTTTQVTPFSFAANGDGPVYGHEPGSNMRIASRRSNGIWIFHDVDPATGSPLGIHDPTPSPTSPFTSSPSAAPSTFTFEPRGYSSTRSDPEPAPSFRTAGRKKSYDFLNQNVATFVEREKGLPQPQRSASPVSSMSFALPSLPSPTFGADTEPQLPSIAPLSTKRTAGNRGQASARSQNPFSP